jgi:uncharacterized protein (DUF1499 family)
MMLLARIAVALALVALAFGAYVRLAPSDPAVWAVDPLTATPTGKPNAWRVGPEGQGAAPWDAPAPVYAATAAELAAAFDAVALGQPRTTRLAGGPPALEATYVQRSLLWGFPDYVSVRAIDLGEGRATLAVYSRSRFGYGDMGVNRARVEAWLAALPTPPAP